MYIVIYLSAVKRDSEQVGPKLYSLSIYIYLNMLMYILVYIYICVYIYVHTYV